MFVNLATALRSTIYLHMSNSKSWWPTKLNSSNCFYRTIEGKHKFGKNISCLKNLVGNLDVEGERLHVYFKWMWTRNPSEKLYHLDCVKQYQPKLNDQWLWRLLPNNRLKANLGAKSIFALFYGRRSAWFIVLWQKSSPWIHLDERCWENITRNQVII